MKSPQHKEAAVRSPDPVNILTTRLALLKDLLGAGWLASRLSEMQLASLNGSHQPQDHLTWAEMEILYHRVINWLTEGLDWLCSLTDGPEGPLETVADAAAGSATRATALMSVLKRGVMLKPAGVPTVWQPRPYDLLHCIVPTLAHIFCLHEKVIGRASEPSGDRPARLLVGIAGVPGAGKSVLASALAAVASLLPDRPSIQAIGMDGWHLPNERLKKETFIDETGRKVALISRKGCPESFDAPALAATLDRLARDEGPITVPAYDRTRHEPVPHAVTVEADIVLLEGNYVLMPQRGWQDVAKRLHCGIWLDTPLALARSGIIQRHIATGRTPEQAEEKWRENDWPNSLAALTSRNTADAIISVNEGRRMRFVHKILGDAT